VSQHTGLTTGPPSSHSEEPCLQGVRDFDVASCTYRSAKLDYQQTGQNSSSSRLASTSFLQTTYLTSPHRLYALRRCTTHCVGALRTSHQSSRYEAPSITIPSLLQRSARLSMGLATQACGRTSHLFCPSHCNPLKPPGSNLGALMRGRVCFHH
jgi:hypothetical protein